jgi:hypothetical protein
LLGKELNTNPGPGIFYIERERTNLELGRTCFSCIENSSLRYTTLNDVSWPKESPLLRYAARHWPEHARCRSTLGSELLGLSKIFFFQNDCALRRNWWRIYVEAKPWETKTTPGLLYMACSLGIVAWGEALLLTWMAWIPWIHNPIADMKDKVDRTPLSWAAEKGHLTVVGLLVKRRDVKADSKDKDGRTPLLNSKYVNPDNEGMLGGTSLCQAAENGHAEAVSILFKRKDVDPNYTMPHTGMTPLTRASAYAHEEVLKLLLTRDDIKPDRTVSGQMDRT